LPRAYSLNITVTNTLGPGFISLYPTGGSAPLVSTLNYVGGQTIANAAIVPAGTAGAITAVAGVSGTDLIIDINGYYGDTLGNPSNIFRLTNNSTGFTMVLSNQSTTCGGTCGLFASVASNGNAIEGETLGTTGGFGLVGRSHGGAGTNTAGVRGLIDGQDITPAGGFGRVGVRGESTGNIAVWGLAVSGSFGVVGDHYDVASGGTLQTQGFLGYSSTDGVHATGQISATGAKPFVDPHPTDATKVIKYVAVESNMPETATRGRARFQQGYALINLPDHFKWVTEPEGLGIQITPIGEMASYAVMRIDLDGILVQGSRDVEFFYAVSGIRRGYADWQTITENAGYYVPISASSTMPTSYNSSQRERLIQNGTYLPGGKVNVETARQLGWDKIWQEREDSPRAQPKN
jgi:hypothetical protein